MRYSGNSGRVLDLLVSPEMIAPAWSITLPYPTALVQLLAESNNPWQ
jgi:hypothetical protein